MARRRPSPGDDLLREAARAVPWPCVGETFLSWGPGSEPDDPFDTHVECDAGPTGDCGWYLPIEQGDPCGSVTTAEMRAYADQHQAHRKAKRHERLCASRAVFFGAPEPCALLPGHEGQHIAYLRNETGAWSDEHAEPVEKEPAPEVIHTASPCENEQVQP